MAIYRYRGRNRNGVLVNGKLKSDSEKQAREKLREKNINVVDLKHLDSWLYKDVTLFQRVKTKDFLIFLRQFSTLLHAGLSLVESIEILAEQTSNKLLAEGLKATAEDIRKGATFSEAAEKQRHVFPSLFTNMIKAGEAGGNIEEILDRLALYYEKQHQTKQKVISAVSYPAVVGFVAAGVVMFLLAFVVPMFADMFAGFGGELPWLTAMVLAAGEWMQRSGWILIVFAAVAALAVVLMSRDKKYKYYLDYALLKLPIFGSLLQKAAIARMSRTLASLFSSSVPVLHATSIVERVVGNEVLAKVIRDSRQALEKGESMAEPMEKHWIFPPLVTQMVVVGEKTGALDSMLSKVADFYEAEVDQATERLKTAIEPILIVSLAVVVGVIVAAIAIPMFEIFDTI
ncbi:type II secretion system F family protein [Alteribacter natronophilus]|uniref:type II secretion system F family protein n=1 Tax=Alteribacter natronophilus TaxID=2583810 RepID=UPI00110D278C|nr:type II secretion system F family protein [Alteribacter natronophilus]TMW71596.1 type II secretion system F family protein [Alteribacter natronophilus]